MGEAVIENEGVAKHIMTVQFFIPLKSPPNKTHQMKKWTVRNGKPVSYEPSEVEDIRMMFMARFAPYVPDKPMQGPISLTTKWVYPANKRHPVDTWKITRPDTDNLVKLPKDVLTVLGFWKDDAQVACEMTYKFYGSIPGLYIQISEI